MRTCECGADISHRGNRANQCEPCYTRGRRTRERNRTRRWREDCADKALEDRTKALRPYLEEFDRFVRSPLGKEWAVRELWPTINYGVER